MGADRHTTSKRRLVIAVILALAVGLRVYAALSQPTALLWFDSGTYIQVSQPGAIPPLDRPLGYGLFLRLLQSLGGGLALVTIVQYAMGLATGLLLWAIARMLLRGSRWADLALLALFWPTSLLFEAYLLSETCFLFLLVAAAALGLWSRRLTRRAMQLAAAAACGLALGAAVLVRMVGLFYVGFAVLALLWSWWKTGRARGGERLPWGALATGVTVLLVLLPYVSFFSAHHGRWAVAAWSGINRYSMLAHLVRPEHGPDARSQAFLRKHAARNSDGFDAVMWEQSSPLYRARAELGMSPAEVNEWASRVAWRALLDRPREVLGVFAGNVVAALTERDDLWQQIAIAPRMRVYHRARTVYGWRPPKKAPDHPLAFLRALYALQPLLYLALALSLVMALRPRWRHHYQLLLGLSATLFYVAVSASIQPEQRHMHTAELTLLLLGVCTVGWIAELRRRAAAQEAPVATNVLRAAAGS